MGQVVRGQVVGGQVVGGQVAVVPDFYPRGGKDTKLYLFNVSGILTKCHFKNLLLLTCKQLLGFNCLTAFGLIKNWD
jgi:hypothetical protein